MKLLNLGCGSTFHKEWVNVDFNETGKEVIAHNLLKGIPFSDSTFDVVYHSHVLEHFSKEDGIKFIKECYRVLKIGGIIRIAVPDLETIVKEYLKNLERAINNEQLAEFDYEWSMLELFDQTTRNYTGGEIGKYLKAKTLSNKEYVIERIGNEGKLIIESLKDSTPNKSNLNTIKKLLKKPVKYMLRFFFSTLDKAFPSIKIGRFRLSGEIHQCMYDRYSLSKLLLECGFKEIEIKTAMTSNILDWDKYQLDYVDGQIRKPDSLFIEARK